MATINFVIRSSKQGATVVSVWASVFISASEKGKRIQFQINTGVKITSEQWDPKAHRAKVGTRDTAQQEMNDSVNKRLDDIKKALFADIALYDDYNSAMAAQVIAGYRHSTEMETPSAPIDVIEFMRWLTSRMESGLELNKGQRYKTATIKEYRSLTTLLERFRGAYKEQFGKRLMWVDFEDLATCNYFMRWLDEINDYLPASRNKRVTQLQSVLKIVCRERIIIREAWKNLYQIAENSEEARTRVYLTSEEIDALYDMPLEPGSRRCQVRDVFVAGCFTGQRVSDYGRLTRDCFRTSEKGAHIVELRQQKTGKHVIIPVLDDRLLTIAERYGGDLPKIRPQSLGRDIKLVLEELSKTIPSLAVKFPTVLTIEEKKAEKEGKVSYERDSQGRVLMPKWQLVSTHTARRSCITNLYKLHLFTDKQIMSISGHSSLQTYFNYISQNDLEIAEEISKKMAEFNTAKNENLF